MRSTFPAAVYLCLRDGTDILLLRRAGTGYRDGELAVPAGHIEAGESATRAVLRETREEILLDLAPHDVRMALVQHGHADGDTYIDFFFVADRGDAQPAIGEPDKASELLWAPVDRLPADVVPAVRHALEAIGRGESYTEFGWD
jgi:8-oxo-dGTP diphosphatase